MAAPGFLTLKFNLEGLLVVIAWLAFRNAAEIKLLSSIHLEFGTIIELKEITYFK